MGLRLLVTVVLDRKDVLFIRNQVDPVKGNVRYVNVTRNAAFSENRTYKPYNQARPLITCHCTNMD